VRCGAQGGVHSRNNIKRHPIDETFDVGLDTRTPVDDRDYQVPFRFTGKINKVTFKLWPTQLTSNDDQVIQHARATARD
jgi:arylsulfatase